LGCDRANPVRGTWDRGPKITSHHITSNKKKPQIKLKLGILSVLKLKTFFFGPKKGTVKNLYLENPFSHFELVRLL